MCRFLTWKTLGALTSEARAEDRVAEKIPAEIRGAKPDTRLIAWITHTHWPITIHSRCVNKTQVVCLLCGVVKSLCYLGGYETLGGPDFVMYSTPNPLQKQCSRSNSSATCNHKIFHQECRNQKDKVEFTKNLQPTAPAIHNTVF